MTDAVVEPVDAESSISILHLADELLEMIFACRQLDHRDVVALGAVCSRFWAISCSRELWKRKSLDRCDRNRITSDAQSFFRHMALVCQYLRLLSYTLEVPAYLATSR